MSTTNEYFDDIFAEAFACFEQGLCFDEVEDTENAKQMYQHGLNLIKGAEEEKVKKSKLYKSIKEARKKVENRMEDIRRMEESEILTRNNLKSDLRKDLESVGTGEADLVFFVPDGVQLFLIEGDEAGVPTSPLPLEFFVFNENTKKLKEVKAEAFIKVGPWIYPLMSGKTPVLKNEFGAYIVPNPTCDHPNMFIGILLPSDLEKECEEDFYNLLKKYTELETREVSPSLSEEEKLHTGQKIAKLLIKGGEKIAWGINYTGERTSQMVTERTSKYRSNLTGSDQPLIINPALRTSVHYVHRGSKIIAKCTRYLLDKIGDMGIAVGRQLASSAERRFGDGKGGGIVGGTIDVIGGGITSASTVWMALEDASKALCKNIANETVSIVQVRYGDDASTTTHKALSATGHTTLAAFQLWDLGPRSVAGRAARKAGIQFVNDMSSTRRGSAPRKDEKKKN